MCGISGCLLNRPLTDGDLARLRAIGASLAHRGPDGEGEWMDKDAGVYLSHRRLSIIDLDARAAQPMQRGSHVISFNGEIYNYPDLKDVLSSRCIFSTTSDTEVLINLWAERGAAALDALDGMYAFALWDGVFLHLVTDPFGEKPLYLYQAPEGLYFASEPAGLIKAFSLTFAPTRDDQSAFMQLGFLLPPSTGYLGLSSVAPAQHVIASRDGLKHRTYWHPPKTKSTRGAIRPVSDSDVDYIRDVLCRSLARRLHADVPLGLFLSGGVDSALVASLAARELGVSLHAYTVAFPDGKDESAYAARIARHLDLTHHIIDGREDPDANDLPHAVCTIYGVPNDNTTALPLRQMCRAAKPALTVALSGLGGDEVFFGYNRYRTLWSRRYAYRYARVIKYILSYASPLCGRFGVWQDLLLGPASRQFLRLKNGPVQALLEGGYGLCQGVAIPEDTDLVFGVRDFDVSTVMPQSYIPPVDRASMREGVEIRTPFLSREVWDAAAGIDPRAMIAFGPKNVTRRLLSRYLPLDLLYPAKQGFTMPMEKYFSQDDFLNQADSVSQDIWGQRRHKDYATSALRLKIWDAFLSDRGEL
jgi:asparagine synthase (glutamine-hydrolysing)